MKDHFKEQSDDNGLYLNFTHIWHTVNKNNLGRDQINYETGSH